MDLYTLTQVDLLARGGETREQESLNSMTDDGFAWLKYKEMVIYQRQHLHVLQVHFRCTYRDETSMAATREEAGPANASFASSATGLWSLWIAWRGSNLLWSSGFVHCNTTVASKFAVPRLVVVWSHVISIQRVNHPKCKSRVALGVPLLMAPRWRRGPDECICPGRGQRQGICICRHLKWVYNNATSLGADTSGWERCKQTASWILDCWRLTHHWHTVSLSLSVSLGQEGTRIKEKYVQMAQTVRSSGRCETCAVQSPRSPGIVTTWE